MDEYGAGPVLAWLVDTFDAFAGLVGAGGFAGAIGLSYLLVGLGLALIITPLRRAAIKTTDRVNYARPGLRRIGQQVGTRSAGGRQLIAKYLTDLKLTKASLGWLAGYALAGALAWWVLVTPWSQKAFRRDIGQKKPSMLGERIKDPFDWANNLVLTGVALVFVALIAWLLFRLVRSLRGRSAVVRAVRRGGSAWNVLIAAALAVAGTALTASLQPDLPLPWAPVVLAAGLGPAIWAHTRRLDRSRTALPELPNWIFEPDLRRLVPAPAANPQPANHQSAQLQPAQQPTPTRVFSPPRDKPQAKPQTTADATPTSVLPSQPRTTSPGDNAETAVLGQDPGAVLPSSPWGALAAPVRPLAAYEPSRVGGWDIAGRIGSGGMAIVYLAYQGTTPVAIKVANPMVGAQVQAPQRLLREIMALSRVGGDSVVAIRDVGIDAEHPYIVMEYLAGPSLNEAVAKLGSIRSQQRLRHLAHRLADALSAIHGAGMAHRDVKPANILLTDRGPVVVDLGIAQLADPGATLTQAGTALGSVGFIAPEQQLSATHGADPARSDVWCWGANVAYAATGLPLFAEPGASPVRILDEVLNGRRNQRTMGLLRGVDSELAAVVYQCTEADPSKRPADGAELAATLQSRRLAPGTWGRPW